MLKIKKTRLIYFNVITLYFSWAGAWNELGNDKRWCWYQIILTNISIFILKTDAHVFCSYARARARIDLKFFLVMKRYGLSLSFKFEKDPSSGCGEIDSQSWSIFIKNTENIALALRGHSLRGPFLLRGPIHRTRFSTGPIHCTCIFNLKKKIYFLI